MPERDFSALDAALAQVGDRWSLLVVDALLPGPRRFSDLQGVLPGVASNVLTQRLRRLEEAGIVVARPYSERPPRFTYELSRTGSDLAGALRMLARWGAHGVGGPRHSACGTPLDVRFHCPTCAQTVDDPEADGLEYV